MKKVARALVVGGVTIAALAVAAGTALADPSYGKMWTDAPVHSEPSYDSPTLFTVQRGEPVVLVCYGYDDQTGDPLYFAGFTGHRSGWINSLKAVGSADAGRVGPC